MKRRITINGRAKGSLGHCADHQVEVDAVSDQDAFTQLYQTHEHIVRAHFNNGVAVLRDVRLLWVEEEQPA